MREAEKEKQTPGTKARPDPSGEQRRELATDPKVAFECVASGHREGEGGPDKLTVFEGQWAFCPYDAKADGHQWVSTGGLPLPMLRHAAALRRADVKTKEAAK